METFALLTHEEVCRELGQRCKHLRLRANLSQLELAQRSGASLSAEALRQGKFPRSFAEDLEVEVEVEVEVRVLFGRVGSQNSARQLGVRSC